MLAILACTRYSIYTFRNMKSIQHHIQNVTEYIQKCTLQLVSTHMRGILLTGSHKCTTQKWHVTIANPDAVDVSPVHGGSMHGVHGDTRQSNYGLFEHQPEYKANSSHHHHHNKLPASMVGQPLHTPTLPAQLFHAVHFLFTVYRC